MKPEDIVFKAVKELALKKKASESAAYEMANEAASKYQKGDYHKIDKLIDSHAKLAVKMSVKNATRK